MFGCDAVVASGSSGFMFDTIALGTSKVPPASLSQRERAGMSAGGGIPPVPSEFSRGCIAGSGRLVSSDAVAV